VDRPLRLALDQLEVLDAIERTGSFAAAARVLHRAPSAVSYAIRQLEDALGLELFDRSGHRAVLTLPGRQVLSLGRAVLEDARALETTARHLVEGWEPVLRVVIDGALPMRPVTTALRALSSAEVPTRVHLDVEYQEGVPHRFETDGADLMLLLGEHPLDLPVERRGLPSLEMVLVAAPEHPLGGATGVTRIELHTHVDVVVRDSSPAFAQRPRETFLGGRQVLHLPDFHTKRRVILDAAGYGWLPRHLVDEDLATGRLVLVDYVEGPSWSYTPQLITRRDRPLGRAGRLFLDALLGALEQDP
jgi:DNA-binding transcriptional LysR family regulator